MWFVNNVTSQFHQTITRIESDKINALELKDRLNGLYLPLKVIECIFQLNNHGQSNGENFCTPVQLFSLNWSSDLNEMKPFELIDRLGKID